MSNIPQLLPLLVVARSLCVSPHTVRSWVRKGTLRPVRICRRLLFHPDEIARFLAHSQEDALPFAQWLQCLADYGTQHLAPVCAFHRMTGR